MYNLRLLKLPNNSEILDSRPAGIRDLRDKIPVVRDEAFVVAHEEGRMQGGSRILSFVMLRVNSGFKTLNWLIFPNSGSSG